MRRAALAVGVLAVAACGGGHPRPSVAPARPAHYLSSLELRRDLGNAFRAGLERLAVMSQPPDDASDLGQPLPTGLLDRVTCAAGARVATYWSWRCTVRWETAGGSARRTGYAVRLLPTGCFAAGADPALAPHRDPTIQTYTEHPLNTFASVKRGC